MTDIIQTNITHILELFANAEQHLPCTEQLRTRMDSDISNIHIDYDHVMCAGIVQPLFRTLETAEIVCKYVLEFTELAKNGKLEVLRIALQMIEHRNAIASEIKLLVGRLQ